MHATVALDEMKAVPEFDQICQGPGENIIVDLVKDPRAFPRVILGTGAKSMAEWPMIDRTLWPKPASRKLARKFNWPLEPECGWGPARCGHHPHQPRLPLAVRVLQRKLLHPQHGPPPGGCGHRRAQLSGSRSMARRLGRHPRLDVLPESQLAGGMDRQVPAQREQGVALLGRRPRRHRAPMARPVRGAASAKPTGRPSPSASSRAATAFCAS